MQNYGYAPYYPSYLMNALQQNYANQLQQQQGFQNGIRVILVSNEDEAKATPAEQNGNPIIFLNKSLNEIYMKELNLQTKAAPLQVFKLYQPKSEEKSNQPDEMTRYNTILEGINGLYRILSTQQPQPNNYVPPVIQEPEKKKGGK